MRAPVRASAGSSDNTAAADQRARAEEVEARLGRVVLGRWTLTRVLGQGGMAAVYEATHRNGRGFALKILHPAMAALPSARRRFVSEGYAANKVGHPGAVTILDDGEDGDLVFLVMELLSGRALAQRLTEQGPLPAKDVAWVAREMLDVLAAAHDRGVVHRDIKPSNVFELEGGEIKLLDFGVAQVREPGLSGLTESGVTLGTPAFMAPEQAAGRMDEVDALTDLWAVGATMFQLLTGRYVHQATSPNAAIVASATRPAPPVRSVNPDVPEDLAQVVDRALSFAREGRFPNARAMQKALDSTLGDRPRRVAKDTEATTLPEHAPSVQRPARGRVGLITVLALGALAGLVLSVSSARRTFSIAQVATPAPSVSSVRITPLPSSPRALAPSPSSTATASASSSTASRATTTPSSPARAGSPTKRRPVSDADDALIETRH